jgi:hypothetical protein
LIGESKPTSITAASISISATRAGAEPGGGAQAALLAVGARKTAAMLERAMSPGTTPEQLAALFDRFYRVPEDLAVLAARHVGLRPT